MHIVMPKMSTKVQDIVNEVANADRIPFQIRSEDSGDGPVEVMVHGAIGDYWEYLDSASLVGFINEHRDREILMRINSPGGSVFDGIAVHTALLNHEPKVVARIEGIAASAASFLTTAADEVQMAKAGSYMIHRAWGIAVGNTATMEDMAEVLGKLDGQLADLYVDRTGENRDQIMDWMVGKEDGTWFNADEAKEHGFVDTILSGSKKKTSASAGKIASHRSALRNKLMDIAKDKIRLDSAQLGQ